MAETKRGARLAGTMVAEQREDLDRKRTELQKAEERLAAATDEEVLLVLESRSASALMRSVARDIARARGLAMPERATYRETAEPRASTEETRSHHRDAPPPSATIDPFFGRKAIVFLLAFVALLLRLLTWTLN